VSQKIRNSHKAGLPPGSPVVVARQAEPTRLSYVAYRATGVESGELAGTRDLQRLLSQPPVVWIRVSGLASIGMISDVAEAFGIHPLTVEDILHTGQRPKVDVFEDYLFVVMKLPRLEDQDLQVEQLSLVFTRGAVVTFEERSPGPLELIVERIARGAGRIRASGTDYLIYAILDPVVDQYFVVLDQLEDAVQELQGRVLQNQEADALQQLQNVRRQLNVARRHLEPMREVAAFFLREGEPWIQPSTRPYMRDLYDHILRCIDSSRFLLELLQAAWEAHLGVAQTRLNEIMKVLTMIATVFMPISFLAAVYGMNFRNMPELDWPWAYPAIWAVFLILTGTMVRYFRRKGWL